MSSDKLGPEAHGSRQIWAGGLWVQTNLGRRPVDPGKFGLEARGSCYLLCRRQIEPPARLSHSSKTCNCAGENVVEGLGQYVPD